MIDTILDPQIWLVLVAIVHAVMGVILPTEWENDTNKLVSGWFLLTSVTAARVVRHRTMMNADFSSVF